MPGGRMGSVSRAHPAIGLLTGAELWLDAGASVRGEQWALNRGTAGHALNARYGSSTRTEVRNGVLISGGSTSNYASVPDEPAFTWSGSLELVARFSTSNWLASNVTFIDQYQIGGGTDQRGFLFRTNSSAADGKFEISRSTDGTVGTLGNFVSTVVPPLVNGATYWVRALLNGTTVSFFYAPDEPSEPTSWIQIGAPVAMAGLPFSSTQQLTMGLGAGGLNSFGSRFIVRNNTTKVLDVDFSNVNELATSFVCSTGQTVTVTATAGTDANDPLLLTHTGTNYLYVPGGSAPQGASVPDAAHFTPVDTLDIRAAVAPNDWTPTLDQVLVSHYDTATANRSWALQINASVLYLALSTDGTTVITATPSNTLTQMDGTPLCVRAVWVGGGSPSVTFYTKDYSEGVDLTSDDGWSVFGTIFTTSVPASLFNSTAPVWCGHMPNVGRTFDGKFYGAVVKSSGVTVLDIDFTTGIMTGAETSFICDTGQTVTVNRTTTGRKTVGVTRPTWLLSSQCYLLGVDNDLLDVGVGQDFTMLAVARQWGTPTSAPVIISKTASSIGWQLRTAGGSPFIGTAAQINDTGGLGGTAFGANRTAGVLATMTGVRDTTTDLVRGYTNTSVGTVADTSTTTLANAGSYIVGSTAAATTDVEVMAVAFWRRALSAAEIATICSFYRTI